MLICTSAPTTSPNITTTASAQSYLKSQALTTNSHEKPATPQSILIEQDLKNPDNQEIIAHLKLSYSTARAAAQLKNDVAITSIAIFLGGLFMTILIAFTTRAIVRPIRHAAELMADIAGGGGDLTKKLPVITQDEIGLLANGFNTFFEKIRGIVGQLSGNATTMASCSSHLSALAEQMGNGVDTMSAKTATVAAAAEEASANTQSVAASMEEATTNLATVTLATQEMDITIGKIAINSDKAREISTQAGLQAEQLTSLMQQFGQAAHEIGQVTETITDISAQTNLLALNATIEAARVGAGNLPDDFPPRPRRQYSNQTAWPSAQ